MTAEEIHNFSIDNKDIEIVEHFAYFGSVINSNRDCSQEIKKSLRFQRAAYWGIGKEYQEQRYVIRDQGLGHPLLPIPNYYVQMWELGSEEVW